MALLAKLKTSKKERSMGRETPENRLRRKMKERLIEQKEFAETDLKNDPVIRMAYKWVLNAETGQSDRVEVPKRIRRWYWKEADDNVCMKLLYGSSPILLNGDNSTIEVKELSKLPETIDTLVQAVEAGELDEALKKAMEQRKGFLRKIK